MQEMLYDRTHEWHSTPLETVALIAMLIGIVLVVRTFSGTPVGIIFACVAFLGYIFDAHLYIPAAISIAIMCTWVSWWRSGQSPDKLQHPWPKLLLDMFIAGGGFLLYELGRVATNNGESRGMENAERMIAVQNWLHLPDEAAFQQFIISDDLLAESCQQDLLVLLPLDGDRHPRLALLEQAGRLPESPQRARPEHADRDRHLRSGSHGATAADACKQHDRQSRPGRVPARVREPIRGAAQLAHRLVDTGRLGHVDKPAPCSRRIVRDRAGIGDDDCRRRNR